MILLNIFIFNNKVYPKKRIKIKNYF